MNINDILAKMRMSGKVGEMKDKGDLGEDAVVALCYDRKQKFNSGLLYQSFKYPYQSDRNKNCYTGNVMYTGDKDNPFSDYTSDSIDDEIDVLYITNYRVFPIEVKSYHARHLDVYEHWFNRENKPEKKSPIMQAEKHARHLYHAIFDVLPDGNPNYIVPMVCFVDNCKVTDDRSQHFKQYVPVCILNNFLSTLVKNNVPLEYNLNLTEIERKLNSIKLSIRRVL